MVKCYRKTVALSNFWVSSHEKLSDFYLCSWQKGESVVPMFMVRLVLAAVALGIFAWSLQSGGTPYWLIYLTNWGLFLITVMTLSGLLVSCLAVCKKIPDGEKLPWYVSLYWLLFNVTVSVALMITALYWILLYDPEFKAEGSRSMFWLDLATHGFNSCIVFIELVLSRTPVRFLHVYQPLSLGLWYAAFSGIYFAAGGTDSMGNPYVYDILDWRQAGRTVAVISASAASLIVLYVVIWGVSICREMLSTAVVRTTSLTLPFTPPDRHMPTDMV